MQEHASEQDVRLLMLAGRRMSGLADVDAGILPGWHNRSRAWWGDEGPDRTLLCLGICDAAGIVRGNQTPFIEAFKSTVEPAHLVYVPDHPVVPCAPVLVDQLLRTPAQNRAIAADLAAALGSDRTGTTSDDWLFAGALLSWLERSPIRDSYELVTPTGLRRAGPADAVLLSLSSETNTILKHKKLGYSLQMLRHRQASAGPAIRAWLGSAFEAVKRSVDDIRRDYRRLIDAIGEETGAKVFILNRMSTSGYEDIVSYAPFDAPMSDTLENIAAKEMNLMLHDLAEECDAIHHRCRCGGGRNRGRGTPARRHPSQRHIAGSAEVRDVYGLDTPGPQIRVGQIIDQVISKSTGRSVSACASSGTGSFSPSLRTASGRPIACQLPDSARIFRR